MEKRKVEKSVKQLKEVRKCIPLVEVECTKENFLSAKTHKNFKERFPEFSECKHEYFIRDNKYWCIFFREEITDFIEV